MRLRQIVGQVMGQWTATANPTPSQIPTIHLDYPRCPPGQHLIKREASVSVGPDGPNYTPARLVCVPNQQQAPNRFASARSFTSPMYGCDELGQWTATANPSAIQYTATANPQLPQRFPGSYIPVQRGAAPGQYTPRRPPQNVCKKGYNWVSKDGAIFTPDGCKLTDRYDVYNGQCYQIQCASFPYSNIAYPTP